MKENGIGLDRVTISSDGNGSSPDGGINDISQVLQDIRQSFWEKQWDLADLIRTVTINPARVLKIYPRKGCLLPGSDADILVLKKQDLSIYRLLAKGEVVMEEGKAIKKGRYEK